jgi:hypothetical protein
VAAVLYRPDLFVGVLGVEAVSPGDQSEMVPTVRGYRALGELAAPFVDRDDGVCSLVGVDTEDHHRS